MNITVPGTTRQTPQAVEGPRLPQDQSFDRIAAAAAGVAQNWSQRELQDRADALRRARVDAADQLSGLSQEFSEDTGFSDMEGRFSASSAQIGAQIRDSLPQAVREEFELGFRDMARGQVEAVGRRAFSLRGDHARADLATALDRYAEIAAGLDDDGAREGILSAAASDLAAAVSAGYISAEAAQGQTLKFAQGVDLVRASRHLRENPESFDPESFAHLTPDQRETLTARKDSELERRALKAEAETAKRERTAEMALGEIAEAALSGLPLTDDYTSDLLSRVAPAGDAYVRRAHATFRRTGLLQSLALMRPAERTEVLDSLRRQRGATPDDTDWFSRLQKLDMGLADAEGREAKSEANALKTEREKLIRDMLAGHAMAQEDGATFAHENELAALVRGTEFEADYQRNIATGDLWNAWRAAPLEGKAAIEARIRALPAADKRAVQLRRNLIRETEAEYKAWNADLTKEVNEHLQALAAGSKLQSYDDLMGRLLAHGDGPARDLALTLNSAHTGFLRNAAAPAATSREILVTTSAGGAPLPRTAAEAKVDRDLIATAEAAAKIERTNPLAGTYAKGIISPLNVSDPASIEARILAALQIAQRTGGPVVLTEKDERVRIKEEIAALPTPQQAEAWRNLATAAGVYGPAILRELEAPEAILWPAEALHAGVPPSLLGEAARGFSAIKSGSAPKMPSAEEQRSWVSPLIGDLLKDRPSDLGRILEATKAVYAARAPLNEDPDQTIFQQAFQAALGGNGERGGVREVAGRLTFLPPSVSAPEAETALFRLRAAHAEAAKSGRTETRHPVTGLVVDGVMDLQGLTPNIVHIPPPPMSSVWGGITSNGAAPVIRGQAVTADTLDDLSLRPVAGGRYALEFGRRGEFYRLEDPVTGEPLTIRLEDLVGRK